MTMHAEVRYLLNAKIPMRDGVELAADLYLPRSAGPFPTVLMRTAFSRDEFVGRGRALASMGFACVAQNFRGRFGSDGVSTPFHGEGEDSFDTLAWIARQPWSNGKIGMGGGSYMGMVQWYCAPLGSPHLTCMVPRIAACDHVANECFMDKPSIASCIRFPNLAIGRLCGISVKKSLALRPPLP